MNKKRMKIILIIIYSMYFFCDIIFSNRICRDLNFIGYVMKCTNLNPLAFFTNPYYFYPIKALIIHLLLFIPVGIIFSEYKHSFLYFIIICIVLECMQLVLRTGVFDINTLILYSIGYFIGSLFSKKIYHKIKNEKNS